MYRNDLSLCNNTPQRQRGLSIPYATQTKWVIRGGVEVVTSTFPSRLPTCYVIKGPNRET